VPLLCLFPLALSQSKGCPLSAFQASHID